MAPFTLESFKRWNRRAVVSIFDWVSALVMSLCVIVIVMTFFFRTVGVDGDSMLPTLHHQDRLLMTVQNRSFDVGDIVVVDRYTEDSLVKRVVAKGGDTLTITDSYHVYVNGELLEEPYTRGVTVPRDIKGPVVIPEGCYFVMGDNRTVSKDSRMNEIGIISEKDIVGKVVFRFWPLDSAGGVYFNMDSEEANVQ